MISTLLSAQEYNKAASFVYSPQYTAPILQLLDAQPGEKIVDFGCGSGEVTLELQRLVGENGFIVGVDTSRDMVEKSLENGVKQGIICDVQDLPTGAIPAEGTFDAVFSNATLHWCKKNPGGVLESAKRLLKPGGRFVVEMGGNMNTIGLRSTLHQVLLKYGYNPNERDPWYFPSTQEYRALLEAHGFRVLHISLNPRVTPLQTDLRDWLRLFCKGNFFIDIDKDETDQIMEDVRERCAIDHRDASGRWSLMYMRLRVLAVLTEAPDSSHKTQL